MEVDHGRAARAGAQDKAAAEHRVATRKRRWRRGVLAVLLVPLLLVGVAYLADRLWFGPPSLAIGTHHAVTLRVDPRAQDCPDPFRRAGFEYGGAYWTVWSDPPQSWGTKGPWKGELTITRPVNRRSPLTASATPNGTFSYDGSSVEMYGGGLYEDAGPIC